MTRDSQCIAEAGIRGLSSHDGRGGLLFSFSCSGGIGPELFQKTVAGAAIDAGIDAAIVERLAAAPDHPATLFFPEGDYLKGLALLRIA